MTVARIVVYLVLPAGSSSSSASDVMNQTFFSFMSFKSLR